VDSFKTTLLSIHRSLHAIFDGNSWAHKQFTFWTSLETKYYCFLRFHLTGVFSRDHSRLCRVSRGSLKQEPLGIAGADIYRLDALPDTQPTASKHWKKKNEPSKRQAQIQRNAPDGCRRHRTVVRHTVVVRASWRSPRCHCWLAPTRRPHTTLNTCSNPCSLWGTCPPHSTTYVATEPSADDRPPRVCLRTKKF